jgi:hypothetical protein
MSKSIAATTAAANSTTAEAGLTGEVSVLGHRFLEWIKIVCHHGLGEHTTVVGFHAFELRGARTEGGQGEADDESWKFHR